MSKLKLKIIINDILHYIFFLFFHLSVLRIYYWRKYKAFASFGTTVFPAPNLSGKPRVDFVFLSSDSSEVFRLFICFCQNSSFGYFRMNFSALKRAAKWRLACIMDKN